MISLFTGIIASSYRATGVVSNSFTVYSNCNSTGSQTVYSASSNITSSILLFTNSNLTIPYANQTFYYGSPIRQYSTNGSGSVSVGGYCFNTWSGYTDCTLATPVTKYTYFADNLGASVTLYDDSGLTTPFTNGYFYYNGIVYPTDGSGVIGAGNTCPTVTPLYSDCNLNSISYNARSNTPFGNSVTIYSDDQLTTPITNASFYFGPSARAGSTDGSGVVSIGAYCYNTYTTYSDCASSSPTTVYGFYNRTLSAGEFVFTDTALSTPLVYTTFVYLNRRLTTDINGYITNQTPATCPAYITPVYTDCSLNSLQQYLRSVDSLNTTVVVYTDDALTTLLNGGSFYYEGPGVPRGNYITDSNGVVTLGSYCYNTWATYADCNSYRDNGGTTNYYTFYADAILQVGVTVYTDTALTIIFANSTFVRNGQVYTTDGNGDISTITNCVYSLPYSNSGCNQADYLTIYTSTTYTTFNQLYNNSVTLYSDSSLTSPAAFITLYKYGESVFIGTDGFGVVNSINNCST